MKKLAFFSVGLLLTATNALGAQLQCQSDLHKYTVQFELIAEAEQSKVSIEKIRIDGQEQLSAAVEESDGKLILTVINTETSAASILSLPLNSLQKSNGERNIPMSVELMGAPGTSLAQDNANCTLWTILPLIP